ncbi:Uncharacterised protein [Vibrio cholerae]|uniref:Uncharacterized protein n=1 Tax=Vibrio cholerae TaxID=666 RepID=A0A655RQU7_VIBCL|nr:Uncharacterised protein [Vibrio cholerae]CSA47025.1 Uncharacterised protein [Vibrio cholerae]CSB00950.1 Uncharacterised protein [Vibrio cholerae]CSB43869.1 Uncharacterised protein [Vibrio cholerae]CSB76458.1 Uncharacterised protein [Vibrio cholerae]
MVEFAIVVQVIQIDIDNISNFRCVTRFKGFFQNFTSKQLTDSHAVECLTFTWFYILVFENDTRLVIKHNFETAFKFIRANSSHFFLLLSSS